MIGSPRNFASLAWPADHSVRACGAPVYPAPARGNGRRMRGAIAGSHLSLVTASFTLVASCLAAVPTCWAPFLMAAPAALVSRFTACPVAFAPRAIACPASLESRLTTATACLVSRLMVAPTSLASCLIELFDDSSCPDDVDAIARQAAAAASNRCAFTPVSHVIVGIVPAPGVQILRLINIESQFTRFEYAGDQARAPRAARTFIFGRPQQTAAARKYCVLREPGVAAPAPHPSTCGRPSDRRCFP